MCTDSCSCFLIPVFSNLKPGPGLDPVPGPEEEGILGHAVAVAVGGVLKFVFYSSLLLLVRKSYSSTTLQLTSLQVQVSFLS